MRKINWLEILKIILAQNHEKGFVIFNGYKYVFKCIVIIESSRLGYMVIWEVPTKRAVKISRLVIPSDYRVVDENQIEFEIPNTLVYESMNG
jgi:hypothetical protein